MFKIFSFLSMKPENLDQYIYWFIFLFLWYFWVVEKARMLLFYGSKAHHDVPPRWTMTTRPRKSSFKGFGILNRNFILVSCKSSPFFQEQGCSRVTRFSFLGFTFVSLQARGCLHYMVHCIIYLTRFQFQ